jgi:hypothetical protein
MDAGDRRGESAEQECQKWQSLFDVALGIRPLSALAEIYDCIDDSTVRMGLNMRDSEPVTDAARGAYVAVLIVELLRFRFQNYTRELASRGRADLPDWLRARRHARDLLQRLGDLFLPRKLNWALIDALTALEYGEVMPLLTRAVTAKEQPAYTRALSVRTALVYLHLLRNLRVPPPEAIDKVADAWCISRDVLGKAPTRLRDVFAAEDLVRDRQWAARMARVLDRRGIDVAAVERQMRDAALAYRDKVKASPTRQADLEPVALEGAAWDSFINDVMVASQRTK